MRSLIIIVCFCFYIDPVVVTPVYSQDVPHPDIEKLEKYFQVLSDHDRFMGSVFLMHGPDIVFRNSYGFTNEDKQPASDQTVYRIGSITKSFTSTMILRLAEQGKLTLDAKLGDYFPEIPNAGTISIEHMLRHESGLVNFTNMPEYETFFTEEISKQDLLNLFIEYGTSFEPGESVEYSNTSYVLLGYIIEEVTGKSYEESLEELITGPLQLERTYFGSDINTERGEAYSFIYQSGWQKAPQTNMFIPHGAGAIVSTPEEVARFYHALFHGDLISEESLETMADFKNGFGLGIIRFPFHNRFAFGHTGGIDGFHSSAGLFPEENITFAILGNGLNYVMNDIVIGLLSITFDMEYEIPDLAISETIELSESEMEAYIGNYSSDQIALQIKVFIENGRLMAQATGQGAFPLSAVNITTMIFEQAGLEMEFDDYIGNRFRSFTLKQAGQQFLFVLDEE